MRPKFVASRLERDGDVAVRILFVAMPDSVHTARWVRQVAGIGWDLHLYPVYHALPHLELVDVTVHDGISRYRPPGLNRSVRLRGVWPFRKWLQPMIWLANQTRLRCDGEKLAKLIRKLKPDIVHSLEFQHSGYMVLEAKEEFGEHFPRWIATNWGSDIYLFGRLREHEDRIRGLLAACDYYGCECQRDVRLAKDLGLKGEVLPVLPNTGGFDLAHLKDLREKGPPSGRRLIVLKGYQHWAGRALVGLRAIALCAEDLHGYRVAVYSAGSEVRLAAELVSHSTGIPIDVVPPSPHDDILRLFGSARIYVGLSISDAISTSLLEALVMGTFPIQSCTSCADEWIVDGESGLIVPPEDPEPVAAAIRRAVRDDALVDRAANLNAGTAGQRLDRAAIQPKVVAIYERIAATPRSSNVKAEAAGGLSRAKATVDVARRP
jgi:glycosyltransferase involved in cell wall biosynthesis